MKPRHLLLIASIAAFALSAISAGGAFANDRYAAPPPLTLSSTQSAPWIKQLQSRQYTVESALAAPRIDKTPMRQTAPRVQRPVTPKQKPKTTKAGLNPVYLPQDVDYKKSHKAGTIVIDTKNKFLYLVGENGTARRYGVGVGKQGFSWKGTQTVSRKAEWPTWHPPKEMIARERKKGRVLPVRMDGGVENPLGARALYLGNTLYRIHGTNAPSTIGRAVSSGCIRMRNQDVEELYELVPVGTKVVVL
ncbi:L,D-transpeptidase [Pseudochrobactrum sp. MP213Fo]|uniref:L,D-transpeptidase n=1 Tax=Pseudochrobactrum sp. MP213Fo TaxID=3022250 RepID=UPI003BA0EC19